MAWHSLPDGKKRQIIILYIIYVKKKECKANEHLTIPVYSNIRLSILLLLFISVYIYFMFLTYLSPKKNIILLAHFSCVKGKINMPLNGSKQLLFEGELI